MPNFFVEQNAISADEALITGDDARHIARSLRMAEGDTVTVSDNSGRQYIAQLTKIRDDECKAKIYETRNEYGESSVEVTLFMGYPKSDKLELIVQKATELGVFAIIPLNRQDASKDQTVKNRKR